MKIILSHVNTDFDALASMLAARKLYPHATIVISDKQYITVKQFLAIYRDTFEFITIHQVDWDSVTDIILVDVQSLSRTGCPLNKTQVNLKIYDHHPLQAEYIGDEYHQIEQIGATITLLLEEIQQKNIPVTPFESTIYGLGLYTDTGSFTYKTTTKRDLEVASFLLEKGMNLELINRFSQQIFFERSPLLHTLLQNEQEYSINGVNIVVSSHQQDLFEGGLATVTRKLLDATGADAVITVVQMEKRLYIVGRATSDRINLLPLFTELGGGGHKHAASVTLKKGELEKIRHTVSEQLGCIILPAITAKAIMSTPVRSIPPDTSLDDAAEIMFRFGHTGLPVKADGELIGMISRRDVDKGTHHGLGHAPVKAYMSKKVYTILPQTTLEEIQQTLIKYNIGRLPVMDGNQIIGIVSRTDIIEVLHNDSLRKRLRNDAINDEKASFTEEMKSYFTPSVFLLLQKIGRLADEYELNIYMIGGIVRDLLLQRPNDDIDLVVEGDAILFSKQLVERYGGETKEHHTFGTATWYLDSFHIDIVSSRTEYYEKPAALPTVEHSNLRHDLVRRDFTINAMAIVLNDVKFGKLIDFFNGMEDLKKGCVRILHNLSFIDDPTRLIRAIRFELRLGFNMDPETEDFAKSSIYTIKDVSPSRLLVEFKKLFQEGLPYQAMSRLNSVGFWMGLTGKSLTEHELTMVKQLTHSFSAQSDWFYYLLFSFLHRACWEEKIEPYIETKRQRKIANEIKELFTIRTKNDLLLGELHRQFSHISLETIRFLSICMEPQKILLLEYLEKRQKLVDIGFRGDELQNLNIKPGPIYKKAILTSEIAFMNNVFTTKEQALYWLKKELENK
ncbi:CBS domain-containing protein [Bacillus alkalicellulosilyticus]|uniref:CBS domain-containing protein n=1 Tax=Alkalihalobacterium alkalicellulosilyticum TaxID=1912214 RepID=UPI000998CC23|nr:CBS domain-containing protein [Bacillus alkalicellulosilyticus]